LRSKKKDLQDAAVEAGALLTGLEHSWLEQIGLNFNSPRKNAGNFKRLDSFTKDYRDLFMIVKQSSFLEQWL
jgi:hypothetical protein